MFSLPDNNRARLVVFPRAGPRQQHLAVFLALEAVPVDSIRNRDALRKVKKNIASESIMVSLHMHVINESDQRRARGEVAGRTWGNLKTVSGICGSERLVTHQQMRREPNRFAPKGVMTLRVTVLMNKGYAEAARPGGAPGAATKKYESFSARAHASLRFSADGGDMVFLPGAGCPSGAVGAHKLVIGASSAFFADVFREAEQNGATAKMRIACPTGVTETAIKQFVKFAYLGGEIDTAVVNNGDLMQQLFTMADVFRFDALCDACVPYAKAAVTEATCCDMAISARKSGCKRMEDIALRFLCDHSDAVMGNPGALDKFNDVPEMALEVMKQLALRKTETEISKKRPREADAVVNRHDHHLFDEEEYDDDEDADGEGGDDDGDEDEGEDDDDDEDDDGVGDN